MQTYYKVQWGILRFFAKCYFRLTVSGHEHIPSTGPVIVAANHCSFLDPPLIGLGLTRQISFLAKKELFKVPFIGWWIGWVGAYPVSRGQGDAQAVRVSLKLLKKGAAILAFPEGTRSRTGKLQPFESGVAWLALKSQAKVLPVYIHNTFKAMPPGKFFPKPYKIYMTVGEAIDVKQLTEENDQESIKKINLKLKNSLMELESLYKKSDKNKE